MAGMKPNRADGWAYSFTWGGKGNISVFFFRPPSAIGIFVEVNVSQPAFWKSHRPKTKKGTVVASVPFIFFPICKSTHVLSLHLKNSLNALENFPHFVELKSRSHRSCGGRIWFITPINPPSALRYPSLSHGTRCDSVFLFFFIFWCPSYKNLSLKSGKASDKTDA